MESIGLILFRQPIKTINQAPLQVALGIEEKWLQMYATKQVTLFTYKSFHPFQTIPLHPMQPFA